MESTLSILHEMFRGETPVSFRTFVESPDYCDCQDMYEFWKEHEELLPEVLSELLIDGSLDGVEKVGLPTITSPIVFINCLR